MAVTKNLLRCESISYSREGNLIIDNVSFEINFGDIITIIGPNGGGKTTLIKLLLGILATDKGKIIKGKSTRIGYMPQKITFNKQMPITVRDFLFLNYNVNYNKIDINEIIAETSIDYILDRQVHNISGGELQRVLLAKALFHNPNLMILDEPLQGLDIKGQADFYLLLDKIRKAKKIAILMVSHDLHTVMRSTNHVICLNKHVCCQGLPEIIKEKSYEQMFGISTSNVLAYYQHHHNHKHDHNGDCNDSK